MRYFVTYAYGGNLRDCFSVVEASNYSEARNKIFEATGGRFAFMYEEGDFEGQVEKYHLEEVPLQPQSFDASSD